MTADKFFQLFSKSSFHEHIDRCDILSSYLDRLNLWPTLFRRYQEEEILKIVPISLEWLEEERQRFLGDSTLESVLQKHQWSLADFDHHLSLPEALRLFSVYRFSPGLEEYFLAANGGHDQVIYSLLRVRDPGLAQELWIRVEEGEKSFSELASEFGEGPEASKKGLIGPAPLGSINPPELRSMLRSLPVSKVTPPTKLGDWIILVRLEQLSQSRFDDKMKSFLLEQQLDNFLTERVNDLLLGNSIDPLEYKSSS